MTGYSSITAITMSGQFGLSDIHLVNVKMYSIMYVMYVELLILNYEIYFTPVIQ